jgi:hypothetical protein
MVESLEGVPAYCNTLDEKDRYTKRYAFLQASDVFGSLWIDAVCWDLQAQNDKAPAG